MPEQQNPEQQLEYLKELRAKYEEALSNAQKSGDYSEAEKLKEELNERLTVLEAQFPKPEPKEESLEYEINPDDKFEQKAIEELEKYFEWGVKGEELLKQMSGFGSDKAMELRTRLIKGGHSNQTALFMGLAGVDNEDSWKSRDSLNIDKHVSKLLLSIGGLDSERAWNLRDKIHNSYDTTIIIDDFMIVSLIGLDSERAWSLRRKVLKKQNDGLTRTFLRSLAGLDSKEAWQMRLAFYTQSSDLPFLVGGLVGIDNKNAWFYRQDLQEQINAGNYSISEKEDESMLAKSLVGVVSMQALEMREKWAKLEKFDLVAKSLAGFDDALAWEMRNKLEENVSRMKLDKLDVLGSINGDPTTAIGWRTARKNQKKE